MSRQQRPTLPPSCLLYLQPDHMGSRAEASQKEWRLQDILRKGRDIVGDWNGVGWDGMEWNRTEHFSWKGPTIISSNFLTASRLIRN